MVELAIVLGLVGVAGLGVMAIMGGGTDSIRGTNAKMEKAELASSLGVYLYSNLGCTDLKTAPVGDDSYSTTAEPIRLSSWKFNGMTNFGAGTRTKHLSIKSLMANMVPTPGAPTISMGGVPHHRSLLKIRVEIEQDNKIFPHEFNVPVLMTAASNTITSCGDDVSAAEACGGLGGDFDPVNKCKLPETCTVHGSYVTLHCSPALTGQSCDTSRGTPQINPVTGTAGCPLGSLPIATAGDTWNTTYDCGKKCTAEINHSIGYFTCIKCPPPT